MPAETPEKIVPPYGAYKSVKAFVGVLAKTVFPAAIDRDMMKGMSGATQSEVYGALRFLACIDAGGNTTDHLRGLVKAYSTDKWPATLLERLNLAYHNVVKGVNLQNGSAQQLSDAFKKTTGAQGFMLNRYVRFFLTAMKDAGIELSPHFKVPSAPKVAGRKKPEKSAAEKQSGAGTNGDRQQGETPPAQESKTPPGMIDYPILMGDKMGMLRFRTDITLDQVPVVEAVMNVVKAMAEANSAKAAAT